MEIGMIAIVDTPKEATMENTGLMYQARSI